MLSNPPVHHSLFLYCRDANAQVTVLEHPVYAPDQALPAGMKMDISLPTSTSQTLPRFLSATRLVVAGPHVVIELCSKELRKFNIYACSRMWLSIVQL